MPKFWSIFCLTFGAGILLSAFFYFGWFASWQEKLSDKLFLERRPPADIIIIAVDDKSLTEVGQWPWPRRVHGQLLEILKEAQPRLASWDINFFETSWLGADDDKVFAQALKNTPSILTMQGVSLEGRPNQIFETDFLLQPIDVLKNEAIALGHINTLVDDDGVLRKIPLYIKYQDIYLPSLSLAAYGYLNNLEVVQQTNPQSVLNQLGLKENNLRINFVGSPGKFSFVSYNDVLNKKINPAFFKDKIVFIGVVASDLHDIEMTPVSRGQAMAGTEIQANARNTLLSRNLLTELNRLLTVVLIFLMRGLGLLIVILARKVWAIVVLTLTALAVYNFLAFWFFDKGIIFNLIYPNGSLILSAGLAVSWSYVSEQRQRRRIYDMFSRFLDRNVVKELLEFKDEAELRKPRLKKITILFSDIEGFTSFSEKMNPAQLAEFLNEYFTAMTNIILDEKGVIDKYIGDAIMAFWGAPLDLPDHASRACHSALRMIEKVKSLGDNWEKRGLPKINIRIGIHTGEVVVGSIGSSLRFDYTAIGDGVNTASRLEGLNKEFGTNIIVSQSTYEVVKNNFKTRYLGLCKIKGKEKEQAAYELIHD